MNKLNLKGTQGVRSSTKANAPFYSFRVGDLFPLRLHQFP